MISSSKRVTFIKLPKDAFFKDLDIWANLLIEVKVYVVGHHFPDDPDKLAGTVPKGIVVRPAFCHLLIVISLKGGIVLNNI